MKDLQRIGLIYENMARVAHNMNKQQDIVNSVIMPFLQEVSQKNPNNILSQLQNEPNAQNMMNLLIQVRDILFDWQDPKSKYNVRNQQQVESLSIWTRRNKINLIQIITQALQSVRQTLPTLTNKNLATTLNKIPILLTKIKNSL